MKEYKIVKYDSGIYEGLKFPIKKDKPSYLEKSRILKFLLFDDDKLNDFNACFINFSFFLEKEDYIFSRMLGNNTFANVLFNQVFPLVCKLDFEIPDPEHKVYTYNEKGEEKEVVHITKEIKNEFSYIYKNHALRKYINFHDDSFIEEKHKKYIKDICVEFIEEYFLSGKIKSFLFSNYGFEGHVVIELYDEVLFFKYLESLIKELSLSDKYIFVRGFNNFISDFIYYGYKLYEEKPYYRAEGLITNFESKYNSIVKELSEKYNRVIYLID